MRAATLVLALLVAGCAAPVEPNAPALAAIRVVDVGANAYEPSIGVTSDGAIYMNAHRADGSPGVWRSTDDGASWTEVTNDADRPTGSSDPWLWVDPWTDRVFSAELQGLACSWLMWTDDGGATWGKNVAGGCGIPGHHFQKITGGPPPAGVTTSGYGSILYYSMTSLRDPDPQRPANLIVGGTGSDVSVSLDGGLTWSQPVRAHPPTPGGYSQAGPVAVALDGRAWSPAQTDDGVRIARSDDAGGSWSLLATLTDVGYQPYGSDPSLAVDADATLFLLHPSATSAPVLRASRDGGATWTSPRSIAPPEVTSTIFPIVRAVGNDTVIATYYGTTAEASAWDAEPSFAPASAAWHLYLARVENASSEDPVVTTVKAEEDPVQRGCIWMRGAPDPGCRNIGDFIGLAAREGVAYVGFVDGCDACPEGAQSAGIKARVAIWRFASP